MSVLQKFLFVQASDANLDNTVISMEKTVSRITMTRITKLYYPCNLIHLALLGCLAERLV